jgi:hypothetical protein
LPDILAFGLFSLETVNVVNVFYSSLDILIFPSSHRT